MTLTDDGDTSFPLRMSASYAVDHTVARRSRALLYTTRIAAIEEARRRSQDGRLAAYDAVALCLDAVAVRMDLESGATWEEASEEVVRQAARLDPGGAVDAHEAVADWLLRQLAERP